VKFCVVRDNDGSDCTALKKRLVDLCRDSGREDTLVRIACQEIEAWYLGAPDALAAAFDRDELRAISARARFRDPDTIIKPSRVLEELVPAFQKVSGGRRMGALLDRSNSSRSFQALVAGLERIVNEMNGTPCRS
jgi:hypothetical protein